MNKLAKEVRSGKYFDVNDGKDREDKPPADRLRRTEAARSRTRKLMTEILAYCGLTCHTCPIYLATRQTNSEEQTRMRTVIARRCQEHYGMDITLAEVTDCDGCPTEGGRLFSGCKKCRIRECARARGLRNCAYCADYACQQLEKLFKTDPTARIRLDQTRSR